MNKLDKLVEELKKAKFCMPDGGGNVFVISEDKEIELDDHQILIILCHMLGVPVGDN